MLGRGDSAVQVLGAGRALACEQGQAEIDSGERLGHDIMQIPADALALFFLHGEEAAGQQAQLLLHALRSREQPCSLGLAGSQ
ncbi:MAG: hypothetical protein ACOYOL_12185 [Chthoniobacterales bacterium]